MRFLSNSHEGLEAIPKPEPVGPNNLKDLIGFNVYPQSRCFAGAQHDAIGGFGIAPGTKSGELSGLIVDQAFAGAPGERIVQFWPGLKKHSPKGGMFLAMALL